MTETAHNTIETDHMILKVFDNSFLELTIKKDVTINEEALMDSKRRLEENYPGVKFYVLAQGIGFFNVTAAARRLSATPEFNSHIQAVAFHTTNDLLKLLGGIYNSINKPAVSTQVFNTRKEAEDWLQLLKEADKTTTSE